MTQEPGYVIELKQEVKELKQAVRKVGKLINHMSGLACLIDYDPNGTCEICVATQLAKDPTIKRITQESDANNGTEN